MPSAEAQDREQPRVVPCSSEEVLACSAGHPGCIAELVRHFYDREGDTPVLDNDAIFTYRVVPMVDTEILTGCNVIGVSGDTVHLERLTKSLIELSLYRFITRNHMEVVTIHFGFCISINQGLID